MQMRADITFPLCSDSHSPNIGFSGSSTAHTWWPFAQQGISQKAWQICLVRDYANITKAPKMCFKNIQSKTTLFLSWWMGKLTCCLLIVIHYCNLVLLWCTTWLSRRFKRWCLFLTIWWINSTVIFWKWWKRVWLGRNWVVFFGWICVSCWWTCVEDSSGEGYPRES